MEQARNMYKEKDERYETILRNLARPSRNVLPMAMVSVEEPTVQKAKNFASKGKVYDFIDEMIEHGSQVIVVVDEKATQIAKLKS